MNRIIKRLHPGEDLKESIDQLTQENQVKAGCLLSIVGSLTKLRLRVADGKTVRGWEGQFEIVSGTGTVSISKNHIHISASDIEGNVIGGHLKEGCVVGTTVELILEAFDDVEFIREPDESTGYDELVVKRSEF